MTTLAKGIVTVTSVLLTIAVLIGFNILLDYGCPSSNPTGIITTSGKMCV